MKSPYTPEQQEAVKRAFNGIMRRDLCLYLGISKSSAVHVALGTHRLSGKRALMVSQHWGIPITVLRPDWEL